MPVHDWTRVDAGIFHAFHQQWIIALSNALNDGILPASYYALPEQYAAKFGPDVLTLQGPVGDGSGTAEANSPNSSTGNATLTVPQVQPTAEASLEFYRRKSDQLTVRHVSGDEVVAVLEIVSPGNKSSKKSFRLLIEKATELVDRQVHLLLVDLFPPGPRDPSGVHAAIWEEIAGQAYALPTPRALTLAAYEVSLTVRAYVRHVISGEALPDMQLFLEPNGCVQAPLERTYNVAFKAMPPRWRRVLEESGG